MDNNLETEKHVYSVSEITRSIKSLLENELGMVWIEGEISNLKLASSGHLYFSLKDESSQIRIVFFRAKSRGIKFTPADGMQVLVQGRITVYENRGEYQLIAEHLEPLGTGALQKAFEELKNKLRQEGIFAEEHKKPIPQFPRKIGIITSPTGAVIQDMLKIINRRFGNIHILIYPVRVQGEGAAQEIAAAIKEMNKLSDIDVLILARGGGSLEDLWAFNEEVVARAIFASKLPLVSAIGHEVDYTIADFVADLRAPTPSAAAELVVKNKQDVVGKINSLKARTINALQNKILTLKNRLTALRERRIFLLPKEKIEEFYQQIDNLENRLKQAVLHFLEISKQNIQGIEKRLIALSPVSILSRGYAIAYKLPGNKILKDAHKVKVDDLIKIKLFNGEVICGVKEISNG